MRQLPNPTEPQLELLVESADNHDTLHCLVQRKQTMMTALQKGDWRLQRVQMQQMSRSEMGWVPTNHATVK